MNEMDVMLEPVRAFLIQLGQFAPRMILVIIILVAGWLLAKAIRLAVEKGLDKLNFHVLTQRGGMDRFLQQGGPQVDTTRILGHLAYWLVILAALVIASSSLGLAYVTDLLGRAAILVSRVVLAVVILVFGSYFAYVVETAIAAHARLPDAELLARLARLAIIAFMVLIALDQLNIGGDLIRQSFLILLAGVVLALALAFGLGGREWAAAMLARWWPRREERKDLQKERQSYERKEAEENGEPRDKQ